jgi:chromosome segregation ATPase
MKIFSRLSGGKKQLKRALQACEEKVVSLKQELDERNKQLKALEEKQVEESNVNAEEIKILKEKNIEYTMKIEDLASRNRELEASNKVYAEEREEFASKIDELNALCSDYKEQVDIIKQTQTHFTQIESKQTISSSTTATSNQETQDIIKDLERKNEALEAALAIEKSKSQRRRKEASDRRARFKERVQNLTRKLSEDESDDETPTESLCDTPKAGNTPKRL